MSTVDYVLAHPERALSPSQQRILRESHPETGVLPHGVPLFTAKVLRGRKLMDDWCHLNERGMAVAEKLRGMS